MATPAIDKARTNTRQVFLYFSSLTLLIYLVLPENYLIDIQSSYILKNQLRATAKEVSQFRLITGIPVYGTFIFGLIRDLWSPFGLRDRGYFILFAPLTAAAFFWMAFARMSYQELLLGMLLVMLAFRFVAAALQGLLAFVGQEKLMSGRLSVLWNTVTSLPTVAGAFVSGFISEYLQPNQAFILAGVLACLISALGLWKSQQVFSDAYRASTPAQISLRDGKRLLQSRAIYPVVIIWFLWSLSPGAATPLQFYLANQLHAPDTVYSYYYGIYLAAMIPSCLIYGVLCTRAPLHRLLWWGTILAIPQMVPLAFIHSGTTALELAVPIGFMGGMATSAYTDLAIRACPDGLQGTFMALIGGILVLSSRVGDLFGSWIYNGWQERGFLYCVLVTTIGYALILPLISVVPDTLVATGDGESAPKPRPRRDIDPLQSAPSVSKDV